MLGMQEDKESDNLFSYFFFLMTKSLAECQL